MSTSLMHSRVHDAKPLRKIKHQVENLLMIFFPGFVKFLKIRILDYRVLAIALLPALHITRTINVELSVPISGAWCKTAKKNQKLSGKSSNGFLSWFCVEFLMMRFSKVLFAALPKDEWWKDVDKFSVQTHTEFISQICFIFKQLKKCVCLFFQGSCSCITRCLTICSIPRGPCTPSTIRSCISECRLSPIPWRIWTGLIFLFVSAPRP